MNALLRLTPGLVLALLVGLLAGPAAAEVLLVPSVHPTIQQAVDVAADRDVILIAPGSYPDDVVVIGKGLALVADGGAVSMGSLRLEGVPAGSGAYLHGLQISGTGASQISCSPGNQAEVGLTVSVCDGPVRIEDCEIRGGRGWGLIPIPFCGEFPDLPGAPAMRVSSAADVVLARCLVAGGVGDDDISFDGSCAAGGPGIDVLSQVQMSLYACTVTGGFGGDDLTSASFAGNAACSGQAGIDLPSSASSTVLVHGGSVTGGSGGVVGGCTSKSFVCAPGRGASAVEGGSFFNQGAITVRDVDLTPGVGGDGEVPPAIATTVTATEWEAPFRRLETSGTPVQQGQDFELFVEAFPGDTILVLAGLRIDFRSLPPLQGVLHTGLPGFAQLTVAGGRSTTLNVEAPALPPGFDALIAWIQSLEVTAAGQSLGPLTSVLIL